jgi:hypothetical protein
MLVADLTDVTQGIDEMLSRHVLPFPIERSLQTLCIPRHDAVSEQGERAGGAISSSVRRPRFAGNGCVQICR